MGFRLPPPGPKFLPDSSNGKTGDFESLNVGSIPTSGTRKEQMYLDTNHKTLSPEKEKLEKKRSELSSRYHSLSYTAEDYDRKKGKGSFSKSFPDAHKLLDSLLKEKTQMEIDRAIEPADEAKESVTPAPVPTI